MEFNEGRVGATGGGGFGRCGKGGGVCLDGVG